MSRPVVDVAELPDLGFGHRALMWWATLGVIAIEGSMFALMMTNYLYLKGRSPHWPPGVYPPALLWGSVNTVLLLGSLVPNELAKKASERFDLRKTQLWLVVGIVFAIGFNAVRVLEFRALNVWWDTNAYGSVVWTLLGLHTTHILTDLLDTLVLTVLMFTGPLEEKRFVDVSENSFYWYFVVLTWLPIYAFIYFAPRVA
jgi:heme/copper-type cytochrome/quinol oxidase subunit 3